MKLRRPPFPPSPPPAPGAFHGARATKYDGLATSTRDPEMRATYLAQARCAPLRSLRALRSPRAGPRAPPRSRAGIEAEPLPSRALRPSRAQASLEHTTSRRQTGAVQAEIRKAKFGF